MADFADDAAEITENYLQVALQNARQHPGSIHSLASVEIATTL